MKRLKIFRLELSKWLRGRVLRSNHGTSLLYSPGTKRFCCLGQFGLQCGVPIAALRNVTMPEAVAPEKRVGDFARLVWRGKNSNLADRAVSINDSEESTDEQKIAALRPLFRKLGYRIEVVP